MAEHWGRDFDVPALITCSGDIAAYHSATGGLGTMSMLVNRSVRYTILAFIAASTLLSAHSFAGPQYRRVTILHTNDTHGHLIPFSYPDPQKSGAINLRWLPAYENIGGIARRATLARQIEREMKRDVLLIDAGDQLDGTPFSVEYIGEADSAAMAAAGYDMKTFGNHEFSASLQQFERNMKLSGCPTLCANLIDRRTGRSYEPQYKIMDFDGAKVAFFGLVTPAPTYKAAKEGYDFLDPIETARMLAPELKKQADIVVAITHIGHEEDRLLAATVPDIDAIVGGHSHTGLIKPSIVRTWSEPQAFRCGTVIAQAGQWGHALGRLDLYLRSDGIGPYTLMSYRGELIPITSSIPEDPSTSKVVNRYLKPIWKQYGDVLGEAGDGFYGYIDEERRGDSTMMNYVCDALREAFQTDIALFNTGGIRGELARGTVRMWDVATVLPFSSEVVTMKISGTRLKKALEELKPGISGISYVINRDNKLQSANINGASIDDAAVYTVVTNSWFVEFGFKDVEGVVYTGRAVRDVVKEQIINRKTIWPVTESRRINYGSAPPA